MPSYLWPMISLCTVLAGYRLVMSGPCRELEACLLILLINFGFLWRELFSDLLLSMPCFLWGLGFAELWAFLPSAYSFTLSVALLSFPVIPFYHSCCDIIWPNPAGPLWACRLFFPQWLNMVIGSFITLLTDSSIPFASFWASLVHLLSLDFLDPFPNSVFPWVFTNSSGLSRPNYLIPPPWGSWAHHQPFIFFTCITLGLLWPILTFLHHILPIGLLVLSFRSPLSLFASSRPIFLFHGSVIHYSCRLGLMVFLSSYQLFSAHVAGFLLSIWIPQNDHQQFV